MEIYQLKITLQYTQPPVWRRVQAPADIRLDKLHDVIQIAMGWTDSHLHAFYINGENYGPPGPMSDMSDERKARLGDIVQQGGRLLYEYDFGDGWVHEIKVENISPAEAGAPYPRCLDGARACPPDDCGGPPGYQNLLDTLGDPEHPEREEMLDWLGGEFNPETFDLEQVNKLLRKYFKPAPPKPAGNTPRRTTAKKRSSKKRAGNKRQ
ncbi:MAG TPA: plasmid pRiA4b ORF-3 family protein [Gammaproteobacteria bacterium]|nr:plasmid pRiA4b ORF-3 family protein [Gammaproteobacteria bacterium]